MPDALTIEAVLFDVYGTLIDILTDEQDPEVWARLARWLRYHGLDAHAAPLRHHFFERVEEMKEASREAHPEVDLFGVFRHLLHTLGGPDAAALAPETMRLFRVLTMQHFAPFPDALPTLRRLRQRFRIGIISDAQRLFLEPELRLAGITPWPEVCVVSSDHGYRKPDPRLFALALDALGVAPQRALYIGDSVRRDICGARAAGLTAVLLSRHDPTRTSRSCPPARVVTNLGQLCAWLDGGLEVEG